MSVFRCLLIVLEYYHAKLSMCKIEVDETNFPALGAGVLHCA